MHNKKTVVGLIIFVLIASTLTFMQTSNFFGQGFTFITGAEIQIEGPNEIYQSECIDDWIVYRTADEIPVHTNCNGGEFEIGTAVDLTNVVVQIKRSNDNQVIVQHRNFEPSMNANQIDSTTWDGVSCATGSTECPPGEYYIEATGGHEDGHFPSARLDFTVIGPNECPINIDNAITVFGTIETTLEGDSAELITLSSNLNRYLSKVLIDVPDLSIPQPNIKFLKDTYITQANSIITIINTELLEPDTNCDELLNNVPELVAPTDKINSVNTATTFRWEANSKATNYALVVSESEDLSSPVITKENLTQTTITLKEVEKLEANTTYYWSVFAGNSGGGGRYPQIFEFTTAPVTTKLTCTLSADEGTSTNPFIPLDEITRFTYDSTLSAGESAYYKFYIEDKDGNIITSSGENKIIEWPKTEAYIDWDGTDDNGNTIASGTYSANLILSSLNDDNVTAKEKCTPSIDVILQNKEGVKIETEDDLLEIGEPFEITTNIPFEYTKKVINVYDLDDNLIDTVAYLCASGETCPIKSKNPKFSAEKDEVIYYDGIRSNGEPLIAGSQVKFKLWVKPVKGFSSVDYSELVDIEGTIASNDCEFIDVQPNSPDYNAVQYVCNKKLFIGYPDKTMALNENLTRAQLIVVAGRLGEQTGLCSEYRPYDPTIDRTLGFKDLNANVINDTRNKWKLDALAFTANCGIIRGYADTTVQLDKLMTHAEWWKIALLSGKIFASSENFDPWFIEYENYLTFIGIYPPNGLNLIKRGDAIRLLYTLKNQLQI
jgi:hypothetical protein